MTGDGLRFALRGGELAAHAALAALESGRADAHVQLCATCAGASSRSKWRFNRALRALAGSPLAMRAASHGADLGARLARAHDRLCGRRGVRGACRRDGG